VEEFNAQSFYYDWPVHTVHQQGRYQLHATVTWILQHIWFVNATSSGRQDKTIIPVYVINIWSNLVYLIKYLLLLLLLLLLLNIASMKMLYVDPKPKHFGELKKSFYSVPLSIGLLAWREQERILFRLVFGTLNAHSYRRRWKWDPCESIHSCARVIKIISWFRRASGSF
jgi:peptidoglycan/LPS O-acetylase OafA/YrhL